MNKKNNSIQINYIGIILIVFIFVGIIAKTIYISYAKEVDGVDIKTFAENRNSTTDILSASRGNIYSLDEKILAEDVNSYTVIAYLSESRTTNKDNPHHVVDKEYTANVLSEYINMSPENILALLNQKAYQVELGPGGRNISERQMQEIAALELPGIGFTSSSKRYYPYGNFASYIVGYAKKYDDGSIVGELGVESYYNDELTGKDGYTTYQQDTYGYQIADTPVITEEAESGKDIYLTIDTNIQMYLENAVEELLKDYTSEWITVTVANAKTGAILGSASSPSYDPNKLNITNYNNPLVSYAYEPGSTMKIFSFMAAMEEGYYTGTDTYRSGSIKVSDSEIFDWNKTGWGTITYDAGFTYSSNVAAVKLVQKLGRNKLLEYYSKFGFGAKTGIEVSNEYSGKINPVYEVEIANSAFGQGITTTPVQNIQALTSLANEGTTLKPYIVEKIVDHDTGKVEYQAERTELEKVVSKETVDKILELMYLTVNGKDGNATGLVYKTDSTSLIGKTGTAQYSSKSGGYTSSKYQTIKSFAGLFPYENPEYIIYISIKDYTGSSSTMGKNVKSIVESIAKYKNLDELVVKEDTSKLINVKNYINKNAEEAKNELSELGLNVVTIGKGDRVINQYPEKGSTIIKGNKVYILTNSKNIEMANVLGWTNNEVVTYCSLANINYEISGYGNVVSQSIEPNTLLDSSSVLNITLSREEQVNDEETEEGEEE